MSGSTAESTQGLKLLEIARREHAGLPVIVMTAHSDLDHAVAAYRGGAFEYLPKPFDIDEAVALVRRAATQGAAKRAENGGPAIPEILGQAQAEVFPRLGRGQQPHSLGAFDRRTHGRAGPAIT